MVCKIGKNTVVLNAVKTIGCSDIHNEGYLVTQTKPDLYSSSFNRLSLLLI